MKKISRILLTLILMMCVGLLASCTSYADGPDEDENGESYIGNIAGFKAAYRPEEYSFVDYYENLSINLMTELANTFGLAYNVPDSFVLDKYNEFVAIYGEGAGTGVSFEDFEKSGQIYFFNDIKSSVYVHNDEFFPFIFNDYTTSQYLWKWNLSLANGFLTYNSTDNTTRYARGYFEENSVANAGSVFNWSLNTTPNVKAARELYYDFYVDTFAPALQVNILQILLGQTPTAFTINQTNHTLSPLPSTLLGTATQGGDATGLKLAFEQNATYVGITEDDKDAITNLIIENIIGNTKYTNSEFTKNDYTSIIEDFIWENLSNLKFYDEYEDKELESSLYDTYPTNMIKDYLSNSFFISSDEDSEFGHIVKANYQSLAFMPTEENYFYEIWMYFASDRVFDINVYYRYYDDETGNYYQSTPQLVSTHIENTFDETDSNTSVATFNFHDNSGKEILFKSKPFDNTIGGGVLQATTPKSTTADVAEFYELLPSLNDFGTVSILNKAKFEQEGQSFFEFVFDVVKEEDDERSYAFKPALSALWFADEYMIYNFEHGLPIL